MFKINENYLKLKAGYLFPEISRRVNEFIALNSQSKLIKLGIGDVTEPLPLACREAIKNAVDEMGEKEGFKGYGPEQGYDWLREKIAENDFIQRGCSISSEEIFVSDGSKCDSSNILDILGSGNKIAVTDPVYPVYVDSNVMAGRTGFSNEKGSYEGLTYLAINKENNFEPQIPNEDIDLIYLCFPNNPTGATLSKAKLKQWIEFALKKEALILFDAAYESFISDNELPHSIYEIEGSKECAIEFRSFSKNAGFTGTRCAFTIIPKNLKAKDSKGNVISLWSLWSRRQSTKFNGVSYMVQRGAEAVYSPEGKSQIKKLVNFYMENASIMKSSLEKLGYEVYGGVNAPYLWIKVPNSLDSWTFFDLLLHKANIVGTPGSGFGESGEGYFRLSAFNSRENVLKAMQRLTNV